MSRFIVSVILVSISLFAAIGAISRPNMELIIVAPDGQGLVEADSGRSYIPFGTNYYDPHTGWAPKLWRQFDAEKVRQHFRVMSGMGVNCARVFLTAGSFQPSAEKIEEQALSKLDTLVEIAREKGVRLILTGPDHWEGQPDTGNPRLRDWQSFREHLADEWVRRQVEAIRRADSTHLVTVGYIQWSYPLVRSGNPNRYAAFNPRRQARWLDFATIHFYPTLGSPFESEQNRRKNIGYLQGVLAYCHTGKPVVLGEFGWYGGGAPQNHPCLSEQQQALWISEEIEASRSLADGWLSWPFADSPESGDISPLHG